MTISTLWVCKDQDAAIECADDHLPNSRLRRFVTKDHSQRVIWLGSSLCGASFDEVILVDFNPAESEDPKVMEWFLGTCFVRLNPGGRVLSLNLWSHLE